MGEIHQRSSQLGHKVQTRFPRGSLDGKRLKARKGVWRIPGDGPGYEAWGRRVGGVWD